MLTTAVVTSTIGRDTLRQTIESVLQQSMPCKHYVFVHGKDYWDKCKTIISDYPSVEPVYLPNNNGWSGYGMAPVYALAPFVVNEDVICYLDDDNWIEPSHVQDAVTLMQNHALDWTFSLRKIVAHDGAYICEDDCESLGLFTNVFNTYLSDNSCFSVKTEAARQYGHAWYVKGTSDRSFLAALVNAQLPCGGTGKSTAAYRLSKDGSQSMTPEAFLNGNHVMTQRYQDGLPWRQPTLFNVPQPATA